MAVVQLDPRAVAAAPAAAVETTAPPLPRNFTLDLTASIGAGVAIGLVGALLPGIARRQGLDPLGLSALAAAPLIASMLSVLAGRIGPRAPWHVAVLRGLGSGLLITLPFLSPAAFVLVALGFWLAGAFSLPFQVRTWGVIYPSRQRGRLISLVRMGQAGTAALAALVGGIAADQIGGLNAVAIAGGVSAACLLAYAGLRAPAAQAAHRYSARESIALLTKHPTLSRLLVAQGFLGGGLIAAAPLYPLVQVDRLALSLSEIGLLGVAGAAATTLSYVGWGTLADRRGGLVVMGSGAALGLVAPLVYALAPGLAPLFVAAVTAGLANAAIDIGIMAAISESAPLDERARYMAGWGALMGVRGSIAPFAVGAFVQAGVLDVAAALWLCGATSAIGTALYLQLALARRTGHRPQSAPIPPALA